MIEKLVWLKLELTLHVLEHRVKFALNKRLIIISNKTRSVSLSLM